MNLDAQQLLNALASVTERLETFQAALWRAVSHSPEHDQAKLRVFKELDRVRQLLILALSPQFDRMSAVEQVEFRGKMAEAKSQFLDHGTKVFLRELDAIGSLAARLLADGGKASKAEGSKLQKDFQGTMVAFSATFTSETVSPMLLRCVTEVKDKVEAVVAQKG